MESRPSGASLPTDSAADSVSPYWLQSRLSFFKKTDLNISVCRWQSIPVDWFKWVSADLRGVEGVILDWRLRPHRLIELPGKPLGCLTWLISNFYNQSTSWLVNCILIAIMCVALQRVYQRLSWTTVLSIRYQTNDEKNSNRGVWAVFVWHR